MTESSDIPFIGVRSRRSGTPSRSVMRAFSYNPTVATDNPDDAPEVVDLMPYVGPVQRLVAWYDRLADPNEVEPDIFELDDIVISLQCLPELPGQLGDDLRLIANASEDAMRSDIIDAIGRLRRLAGLDLKGVVHDDHALGTE